MREFPDRCNCEIMAVFVWSTGDPWPVPAKLRTLVKQGYRKLCLVVCTFCQDDDDVQVSREADEPSMFYAFICFPKRFLYLFAILNILINLL